MKRSIRNFVVAASALFLLAACHPVVNTPSQTDSDINVTQNDLSKESEPKPNTPNNGEPEGNPTPSNPTDSTDPTDPVPPIDPVKPATIYGNWELIDEDAEVTFYFDPDGSFFETDAGKADAVSGIKGTYELSDDSKITITRKEENKCKGVKTVQNPNLQSELNDFKWTLNTSEVTFTYSYSLTADTLIISVDSSDENTVDYKFKRSAVQPKDLTDKVFTQLGLVSKYKFLANGKYEEEGYIYLINSETRVAATFYGDYIFNELNQTIYIKQNSCKLTDGTLITKENCDEYGVSISSSYLDYVTCGDMYIVMYSVVTDEHSGTFGTVFAFLDTSVNYPFSGKAYCTTNNDYFFSVNDLCIMYIADLEFENAYKIQFENNTIKLRYLFAYPFEYDGFYFDYIENEDGTVSIKSKIGEGQTLQELYNANGVLSFEGYINGKKVTLDPLRFKIYSSTGTYDYEISNGKFIVPGLGVNATYEEHFDFVIPYFMVDGFRLDYKPLEYKFSMYSDL